MILESTQDIHRCRTLSNSVTIRNLTNICLLLAALVMFNACWICSVDLVNDAGLDCASLPVLAKGWPWISREAERTGECGFTGSHGADFGGQFINNIYY